MSAIRPLAETLGPVHPSAQRLAQQMDLDANADFVTDRLMEVIFPDRHTDDSFRALLRQDAYDNLEKMWRIVAGREDLEVSAPFGAIAFSDAAAQIGVPLSQFERVYRVGVGLVWSLWFTAAVEFAEREGASLADLIGAPSMVVHSYIDSQITAMLDRYESTQSEHARTREQLQLSVLRQALEGSATLEASAIEDALGVRLDGEHLAMAVRTDRDPAESGLLANLQRAAQGSRVLEVRHSVAVWVMWMSHPNTLPLGHRELIEVLERHRVRAAIGDPGRGLEGLGSTGRDALEASRLQEMLGQESPDIVVFDDLRLEALLMSDPARAERFVRDELRELGTTDSRAGVLRQTAYVWLTTGSHVTTAQRLGVHEHTVRNRIGQIEALVGRELIKRRTELLLALRLKTMLGPGLQARGSAGEA